MTKKVSSLQKQRNNKELLMSELESLEDKLKNLSTKAEKTRKKSYTRRQNTQNLNSILDRWKDVSSKPKIEVNEPQIDSLDDVKVQEEPEVNNFLQDTKYLLPACEELEKSVLKQIKMCINFILSHTTKTDPMLMSLISGTNETVNDYEKLYTQLKLMVFMDKMNQGPNRNELMAFIFSSL